jgi:hypothetical protein
MNKEEIEKLLAKIKSGVGKNQKVINVTINGVTNKYNRSQYVVIKRLLKADGISYFDEKDKSLLVEVDYNLDTGIVNLLAGFPPKYWEKLLTGYNGKNAAAQRKKVRGE